MRAPSGTIYIRYAAVPYHVFHRFPKAGNFDLLSASFLPSFARTLPSYGFFGCATQRPLDEHDQSVWCVHFERLDRQGGSSCLCRGGAHLPGRLGEIWRLTQDLPGVLRRSWLRGLTVTADTIKNRLENKTVEKGRRLLSSVLLVGFGFKVDEQWWAMVRSGRKLWCQFWDSNPRKRMS